MSSVDSPARLHTLRKTRLGRGDAEGLSWARKYRISPTPQLHRAKGATLIWGGPGTPDKLPVPLPGASLRWRASLPNCLVRGLLSLRPPRLRSASRPGSRSNTPPQSSPAHRGSPGASGRRPYYRLHQGPRRFVLLVNAAPRQHRDYDQAVRVNVGQLRVPLASQLLGGHVSSVSWEVQLLRGLPNSRLNPLGTRRSLHTPIPRRNSGFTHTYPQNKGSPHGVARFSRHNSERNVWAQAAYLITEFSANQWSDELQSEKRLVKRHFGRLLRVLLFGV